MHDSVPQDARFMRIPTITDSRYQAMIDQWECCYRAQVELHERGVMEQKAKRFFGKAHISEDELRETIAKYQAAYSRFHKKVAGRPVVCGFGSARQKAVRELQREAILCLGRRAVPQNLGVSTGDWCDGYMGCFKYAWLLPKQEYDPGWAYTCGVRLAGQEAGSGLTDSVPEWYLKWRDDAVSPPHVNFLTRTLSIVADPLSHLNIFAPDGHGTDEELRRIRLGRQMRHRNLTIYSWRPEGTIPDDVCLDQKGPKHGWMYEADLLKAASQVENGTVDEHEFEGWFVARIGKRDSTLDLDTPITVKYFDTPDEFAQFCMDSAWKCHMALRKALCDRLQHVDRRSDYPESAPQALT